MDFQVSTQHTASSTQHLAHSTQQELEEKRKQVEGILRGFARVVVAFSGGVDSTLLAKLAADVLGKGNVLAVTADSPSLAREDLAVALQVASDLDLQHLVVTTREVDDTSYRANTGARCYFCKRTLFTELEALAREREIPVILYGALADDRLEERPGQRAASEAGVRAPLQEARLSKQDVRAIARHLGLPNWDRPQNACLSSRLRHGQVVTVEKLQQVEQAEALLRAEGFRQVRVRHLGVHARIEVEPEAVGRFRDAELCSRVARVFEQLGFEAVSIDRRGYRSGGANLDSSDELMLSRKT